MKKLLLAAVASLSLFAASPSFAYYASTDQPEFVAIEPNESAFWVPTQGANEDTQNRFESEDYFNKNKIAAKLFMIPHVQLPRGQYSVWGNNYVPSGRMIIQPRTPYNREWTKTGRGTDKANNEGLECQTNEGLNVGIEIAIGASIQENDAAKYLFNFGIERPRDPADPNKFGNREAPEIIFTSIYFGYDLSHAMDLKVHGYVSSLICNEISKLSLNAANMQAAAILDRTEKTLTPWLKDRGITLDYIGYAGTWSFDEAVQKAINRAFESSQDTIVAKALQPYADTLTQLAYTQAIRTIADKWDGKLPSSLSGLILVPADFLSSFKTVVQATTNALLPTK
jgi:hypothetical protein